MARARSPNRDKAFLIYKEHKGNIDLVKIADALKISPGTIRGWKNKDQWDSKINGTFRKDEEKESKNTERSKIKVNKNNIEKEPIVEEVKEVLNNTELTDNQRLFCIYYIKCFNATKAAIKAGYSKEYASEIGYQLLQKTTVREEIQKLKQHKLNRVMLTEEDIFQRYIDIAFSDIGDYMKWGQEEVPIIGAFGPVKDKEGKELTQIINVIKFKESTDVDSCLISEVKQGKSGIGIKLQDKMKALQWLSDHMDLATIEQRAKIEKLNAEVRNLTVENKVEETKYTGIPSTMIAPAFAKVVFDIQNKEHLEYVFPGGRGSTKSSFISLEVIDLIMKNDNMHACVLRQVGDTLRTSVYPQIMWAISALGLEDEFHGTVSPLEITRKSTGQKIYFRGADDPNKIKSIKVPFGYIGIAWLEELDQFVGPEAVRKIEQSVIRGGDIAYIFKSFNPPKSASNWANKYIKIPKETRLVVHSTYLDVPVQWLGKPFLDEADFLKEVNPLAYENEYMGIANGSGGNVFENVTIREITDSEIATFDRIYNGVDWGWYPDPWAFNRMYYNAAQRKLYVFDEGRENKKSNKETAKILKEKHNIKPNDKVVCDSSEIKSIEDYKTEGIFARAAIKAPGSVNYSMKWLSSLNEIIIDNVRCPHTATEFLDYEYERDKEGNVISGYPDANNHHIDDIRYALEEVWKRRGQ